jgi:uncharacterized protein YybS (DUF2232 family)
VNQLKLYNQKEQIWGSVASALLFVLLRPFINEFATFFAQIPLFYVALQFDLKSLWISLALALVFVLIAGGVQNEIIYILFIMLPVILLAKQALLKHEGQKGQVTWYPVGRLAAILVLFGFAFVILYSALENAAQLTAQIQQTFQQLQQHADPDKRVQYQEIEKLFRQLIPYFPGISAVCLMIMTTLAGATAQAFLKSKKKLVRTPLSLIDLYLPWWCWKILLVTALGWTFLPHGTLFQYVATNLTIVLLFAFLLQGLSIVHTYIKKQASPQLFLVIIYLVMILFTWPIFILIVLGLLEPWLRLRERFKANKE